MNRLSSTQLFASEKKACGKCGMLNKKSDGCCHDEIKVVKLQLDQITTVAIAYTIPAIDAVITVPSQFIAAAFYNSDEKSHSHNHSPPLLSVQDTYLQINVFRI